MFIFFTSFFFFSTISIPVVVTESNFAIVRFVSFKVGRAVINGVFLTRGSFLLKILLSNNVRASVLETEMNILAASCFSSRTERKVSFFQSLYYTNHRSKTKRDTFYSVRTHNYTSFIAKGVRKASLIAAKCFALKEARVTFKTRALRCSCIHHPEKKVPTLRKRRERRK